MNHSSIDTSRFQQDHILHELKHQLPAQAPLKDFIHHNTLHAFQHHPFMDGIRQASQRFGYNVTLRLEDYRNEYDKKRISHEILDKVVLRQKGTDSASWMAKLFDQTLVNPALPKLGQLRGNWKKTYKVDLDALVHPTLFRLLCSYLDQGISIWSFPIRGKGFLESLRELEMSSSASIFKRKRSREWLIQGKTDIHELLEVLVGDERWYAQYLFDQQFAHQGWSGMISAIEDQPWTLLDEKKISLKELVALELLMEIDALDFQFSSDWKPLASSLSDVPPDLFADSGSNDFYEVITLWHLAYEWSFYDQVLGGIKVPNPAKREAVSHSFQAVFCIDDRECSLRRYLEESDTTCATYGTPGFFGVEFYFQPEGGKFVTKLCPAPVFPKFLIHESEANNKHEKDPHFSKGSHSFHSGWLISQTLGFWSAIKLFLNVFNPRFQPAATSSFKHMSKMAQLKVERTDEEITGNLLSGFSVVEMTDRVESMLKSIGLVKDFAPLVYVVGHGASSVNNPHYAAYDCGACSGRAGSVNARVFCTMANHPEVRKELAIRGLDIPASTKFVGALHDTTRDEIEFFDENLLPAQLRSQHDGNEKHFERALALNAKERSRRFMNVDSKQSIEKIHEKVRRRSISLFEPRPELNHATNALCVVGRRDMTSHLFLDRRSFMNSYDYRVDPEGKYLFNILKAAAPVCGGINLEYFFSRVDNHKLGAGSKLPHNVMGLFAVANGIDGDLRPGLPSQMIEVHEPVRLLIIVEHFTEIVLQTIQRDAATYEWFKNNWVHLAVVNPESRDVSIYENGAFYNYVPDYHPELAKDLNQILETEHDNIPVMLIPQS